MAPTAPSDASHFSLIHQQAVLAEEICGGLMAPSAPICEKPQNDPLLKIRDRARFAIPLYSKMSIPGTTSYFQLVRGTLFTPRILPWDDMLALTRFSEKHPKSRLNGIWFFGTRSRWSAIIETRG